MRIHKAKIEDIDFQYQPYRNSLYQSIKRIGLSFPIKVNIVNQKYQCIDGHKRLSVIFDLLKNEAGYETLKEVNILICNDGSTRSNDCWRSRNTH